MYVEKSADKIMKHTLEGERVRFSALDPEIDHITVARWTQDVAYLRVMHAGDRRLVPLPPVFMRKRMLRWAESTADHREFHFGIRTRDSDILVGKVYIDWIDEVPRACRIGVAVGDRLKRGKGYGTDALRLLVRYAFDELNMHRVSTNITSADPRILRWLKREGFVLETRRREAIAIAGQRFDALELAIVRSEFEAISYV